MLRKIRTEDVELGMFIHRLEGNWFRHPFWKAKFLLDDPQTLATLRDSAVDWVVIDTERGLAPDDEGQGRAPASATRPPLTPPVRPVAMAAGGGVAAGLSGLSDLAKEVGTARKNVVRASKVVSRMFLEARLGRAVAVSDVEPVIDDAYASIQRNLYAFNGLLRCQEDQAHLYRHSLAVSALMIALARQMRLPPRTMREAGMVGLLMDVGIAELVDEDAPGVSDYRDLPRDLFETHVLAGHALLKAAGDIPPEVLLGCLQHHERLDGSGYPRASSGDEIGLLGRMAAICDAYDNLVVGIGGEPPHDPAAALVRLTRLQGQFDPDILERLVEAIGVYPIGALVRLRTGRLAMVVDEDPSDSALPIVRTFFAPGQGRRVRPETIALARCYGADAIDGLADLDGLGLPPPEKLRAELFASATREAAR